MIYVTWQPRVELGLLLLFCHLATFRNLKTLIFIHFLQPVALRLLHALFFSAVSFEIRKLNIQNTLNTVGCQLLLLLLFRWLDETETNKKNFTPITFSRGWKVIFSKDAVSEEVSRLWKATEIVTIVEYKLNSRVWVSLGYGRSMREYKNDTQLPPRNNMTSS